MRTINAEKNALDATKALLDFSKVPATKLGLREALWQHPDFPSLNALSDVLNDFRVPNLSTRLTPDRLHEVPLPALMYLNIDGGMFAPLRNVNGSVEWLHTQRGWQKESLAQFSQKWSGVTLLIEPNEQSGERDYVQNRRRETLGILRVLFIVGAILVILGLLVSNALQTFPWAGYSTYYLIGLTKLAGTFVSSMLVWYSLDTQNEFLQKVCQINGRSNCQSILSSSAAKLTDWLSWAEVGLFYFAGGLLTLIAGLLTGNSELLTSLGGSLYVLTLLVLPYTVWSVYYQWRVARELCVLCLSIQALFWVEFLVAFGNFGWHLDAGNWLAEVSTWKIVGAAFLIMPLLWTLMKPALRKSLAYSPLLKDFQKLKFDPKYLEGLLSTPRTLPPIFEGMKVISMGNPEAENILIVVANPTCSACRRNHIALKKNLERNADLHVQIILALSPRGTDIADQVGRQILSLPAAEMEAALNNWYATNENDYGTWQQNTEGEYQSEKAINEGMMHQRWLELAGVMQVPTSFLNQIELPKFYFPHELPRLCAHFSHLGIDQFK